MITEDSIRDAKFYISNLVQGFKDVTLAVCSFTIIIFVIGGGLGGELPLILVGIGVLVLAIIPAILWFISKVLVEKTLEKLVVEET